MHAAPGRAQAPTLMLPYDKYCASGVPGHAILCLRSIRVRVAPDSSGLRRETRVVK